MSRIVLTGGPGSGKTSVIESLEKLGYNIRPEPARLLIEEYKQNSPHLLPSVSKENRVLFAKTIEDLSIKNFNDNISGFFDRSILDEIGYRLRYNINISNELELAAKDLRYKTVFIFPFWQEIFKTDDIRHETADEAKILFEFLYKAYTKYGYSPIIVPKMSVEERVKFILNNI